MKIEPYIMINGARFIGESVIAKAGLAFDYTRSNQPAGGMRIDATVKCTGDRPTQIDRAGFVLQDDTFSGKGDWRVFVDSGTLAWNGVRRLNDFAAAAKVPSDGPVHGAAAACRRSSLQTVVWHPTTKIGVLAGFLGQKEGMNFVDVWPSADGGEIRALEAWQEFALRPPGGSSPTAAFELQPGQSLDLDPLMIASGDDPLALLDEFGRRVAESLDASPTLRSPGDNAPITGYMTWYSKTAAIDEDTVVGNLPILAELFCGYPQSQRPMLILDHGWQRNASLGPAEAEPERFPRGLGWLAEEINRHGLAPGIWHSLTNVTGDAPNYEELKPLLATDEKGEPLRGTVNLWDAFEGEDPNRTVNFPDANREQTRQWWCRQLAALSKLGMRYFKLDFLALRTSTESRAHAHAGRLRDQAWQTFREAVAPDSHIAPCSCDTNFALGYCDSVRISTDIGEAGKWPAHANAYRQRLSSIAALWYKHRRFWVNDPDSVQVGKGCSMGEARARATAAALSGGHLMLSEDLRRMDEARRQLVQRCLPAVSRAAVPLDLFEQPFPEGYPAIWQWEVQGPAGPSRAIALFNLDHKTRSFRLDPTMFEIPTDREWIALEWWQCRWLGRTRETLDVEVPPCDVAVIHAQAAAAEPSVVSCSHHPSGRYIVGPTQFDPKTQTLSGTLVTKPGLKTLVFGQMPEGWELAKSMRSQAIANPAGAWQCEVNTTKTETPFIVEFRSKGATQ